MSFETKIVGFEKLTKKLDPAKTLDPQMQDIIREAGEESIHSLGPNLPRRSGKSAGQIALHVTAVMARVTIPRFPLVFLEAGTQYPHAGAGALVTQNGETTFKRSRKRRTAAQWKRGQYRIQPRRFLRKEYARIRRSMKERIEKRLKDKVEKAWAAA